MTQDRNQREIPDVEFRRFWQRLQAMGLNAYEARSYLVLVGHPRFKALELAARAHVPRQKIYEVLDSLVEKGFAQVIQEKTKLFSAVPPDQAIPSYLARRTQALEQQLADQTRAATGHGRRSDGGVLGGARRPRHARLSAHRERSGPDRVAFPAHAGGGGVEYLEFSRPPYAVDPLDAELVIQARAAGRQLPAVGGTRNARCDAREFPGGLPGGGRARCGRSTKSR